MLPTTGPILAFLQSGGGNAWEPLTAFAAALYGGAVVLCFVIAGNYLVAGALDSESKTKGLNWLKRGFTGGVFGLLATSIYLFFDGLF